MTDRHDFIVHLPAKTGDAVRRLRESWHLSRTQFAAPLLMDAQRIKNIEIERVELRPEVWLLILLTYDPLFRSKWFQKLSTLIKERYP